MQIDNQEVTPDTTITWTSSDSEIATVDEYGTVHGIKSGNVTITASTTLYSKDMMSTKQITVVGMTLGDLSIQGDTSFGSGETGIFKISGVSGDYDITWSSGNTNIGEIDEDGNFTAKTISNNPITIKATITGYVERAVTATRYCSIEVYVNKYYLLKDGTLKNETTTTANTSSNKYAISRFYDTTKYFTIGYNDEYRPEFKYGLDSSNNYCLYAKAHNTLAAQIGKFIRFNLKDDGKFSGYKTLKAKIKYKLAVSTNSSWEERIHPTGYFLTTKTEFPGETSNTYIHLADDDVTSVKSYQNLPDGEVKDIEIDLTNLSDSKYIYVGYTTGLNSGFPTEVYIYNIWFEK